MGKTTVSVILPVDVRDRLDRIARELDRNRCYIVRTAIINYLAEFEKGGNGEKGNTDNNRNN